MALKAEDYNRAAKALECDPAAIMAFMKVESRGSGFLPSGEPVILFERHVFNRRLRALGIIVRDKPLLVNSTPGGYKGGMAEHARLSQAVQIHREAALESCSWGLGQIMGYHWESLGYESLQEFINDMYESESKQMDAFIRFIKVNPPLHRAIQQLDWPKAARLYNGPAYQHNKYDIKLAAEYAKLKAIKS